VYFRREQLAAVDSLDGDMDFSQAKVAEALDVSVNTGSRDLATFPTVGNVNRRDTLGRRQHGPQGYRRSAGDFKGGPSGFDFLSQKAG
jgi:hypothetical protein